MKKSVLITSISRPRGFALLLAMLIILIITAGVLLFYKVSQHKTESAARGRIADISAQISDAGLQRGYALVKRFLLDDGLRQTPLPDRAFLNKGDPIGYLLSNRRDSAGKLPGEEGYDQTSALKGWQVDDPQAAIRRYLFLDNHAQLSSKDTASFSAVIIPSGNPQLIRGAAANQITFVYQFGVWARNAERDGKGELKNFAAFRPPSFAKDHRLAVVGDRSYKPLIFPVEGAPTYEFSPQLLGEKVDKHIYGTLKITYSAGAAPIWLYVTNEEEGNMVVVDLKTGSEIYSNIAVQHNPCRLWVTPYNYRFVFVSNCNADRYGKPIKTKDPLTGQEKTISSSLSRVDMDPGPNQTLVGVPAMDNVLIHDMAFREEENLLTGYAVDRTGTLYRIDQQTGAFSAVVRGNTPFNLCEQMGQVTDQNLCRGGALRDFDYATGAGGIYNSIVLRPNNHAFITMINQRRIVEVNLNGEPSVVGYIDIPTKTKTSYDWQLGGAIVPRDREPLENFFSISFESLVSSPSNETTRDSLLYRHFYGPHSLDFERGPTQLSAVNNTRGLRRDSISPSGDITEEPYAYYPVFSIQNRVLDGGKMDFMEVGLERRGNLAPDERRLISLDKLPVREVVAGYKTSLGGGLTGPRKPCYEPNPDDCPEPDPGLTQEPVYAYINAAATNIGAVFNNTAALAMPNIGAIFGIVFPSRENPTGQGNLFILDKSYNMYSGMPPDVTYRPSFIYITPDNKFAVVTGAGIPRSGYDHRSKIFYGDIGSLCQVYPPNGGDSCVTPATRDNEGGIVYHLPELQPQKSTKLEDGIITPSAALPALPPLQN